MAKHRINLAAIALSVLPNTVLANAALSPLMTEAVQDARQDYPYLERLLVTTMLNLAAAAEQGDSAEAGKHISLIVDCFSTGVVPSAHNLSLLLEHNAVFAANAAIYESGFEANASKTTFPMSGDDAYQRFMAEFFEAFSSMASDLSVVSAAQVSLAVQHKNTGQILAPSVTVKTSAGKEVVIKNETKVGPDKSLTTVGEGTGFEEVGEIEASKAPEAKVNEAANPYNPLTQAYEYANWEYRNK